MNNSTQELLNETLRKMGRNLLNYQIVEGIWKAQYKLSEVQGSMKNGEGKIQNKREPSRTVPMGWLSEMHRKAIFCPPKEAELEEDVEFFSFRTSFYFSESGELSKNRKQKVLELVKERNALVHFSLGKFNHTNGSGCIEFCALLDEQNSRIIEEINFLNTISTTFKEAMVVLQKFLESEEFISSIENKF